jgi:hypothetical protein
MPDDIVFSENLLAPDQRTESWYKDRAGKFTGSRFVDVLSRNKKTGAETEAYNNLLRQVCIERLTNDYMDSGMDSYALKWGREVEPFARAAYQFQTGEIVEQSGFVTHPTISFVGVSPDGLIAPRKLQHRNGVVATGGTEFKCPKNQLIHMARFDNGMEDEYMPQVQGCIWVFDAEWWDWVSYDPRYPKHMQFYRQRVYRDDAYIKNLETEIFIAESRVRDMIASYSPERIEQILESRLNSKQEYAS